MLNTICIIIIDETNPKSTYTCVLHSQPRSDQIRTINQLLHSDELEMLSSDDLRLRLSQLGIPDVLPDAFQAVPAAVQLGSYNPLEGGLPFYVIPVYRGESLINLGMFDIRWDDRRQRMICYVTDSNRNLAFHRNPSSNLVENNLGYIAETSKTAFSINSSNGRKSTFVIFANYPSTLLEPCSN